MHHLLLDMTTTHKPCFIQRSLRWLTYLLFLYGAAPMALAAEVIAPLQINILSFNVQRHDYAYANRITGFITGQPPVQARADATLKIIQQSNADIIALQEVTPYFLDALRQISEFRQYSIAHTFRQDQLNTTNYLLDPIGQVILSRYPINRSRSEPLDNSRLARELLQVSINIDGQALLISNIHLDSLPEDGDIRAAQLEQVFKSSSYAETSIVAGDFNFSDRQKPESDHLPYDYMDAWLALRTGDEGITYDENMERGRLDRILIRSSRWKPVKIDIQHSNSFSYNNQPFPISDHRAVLMLMAISSN